MRVKRLSELYKRPVWAEINLQAIAKNTRLFRKITDLKTLLLAVVKADGYGHGAKMVSSAALKNGADQLGVALAEEGVALREAGITAPIQILGEIPDSAASLVINNNLIPTVCSIRAAEALSKAASQAGIVVKAHVKVDTGMNRLGFFPEEVLPFLKRVRKLPNLEIEGIFTHFAMADRPESLYTIEQFNKFKDLFPSLPDKGKNLLKHAANSAATILFPETHLDMVRIGISLYGLHASSATKGKAALFPALQLKTKISSVKKLRTGEGVSYGLTYKASRPTKIALLPLGYGDGYTRLLSNKSQVLIRGQRFPVAGTICMDQLLVDVGQSGIKPGEEAVLIGRQGNEEITVDEIAGILGTINYEVVCMINKRVPRIYIG